jgi:hypothetical protein
MKNRLQLLILTIINALLVVACGGGSGSTTPVAGVTSQLTGTVATGSPLTNATVSLIDAKGNYSSSVAVSSDGTYSLPTTGLTAPFVIKATGYNGTTEISLYSVATTSNQVANVTPLTQALAVLATQVTPDSIYLGTSPIPTLTNFSTALNTATVTLQAALSSAVTDVMNTPSSSVDFIKTPFTANHSGFDKLLDNLQVDTTYQNSGTTQVPTINLSNKANSGGFISLLSDGTSSGSLGAVGTFTNYDTSGISTLLGQISALVNASNFTPGSWSSITPGVNGSYFYDTGLSLAGFLNKISALPQGSTVSTSFIPQKCYKPSSSITNPSGYRYSGNDLVCDIQGTVLRSDGTIQTNFQTSVLQFNTAGSWKIMGNQSYVNYGVQTFIQKYIRLDGVSLTPAQTYSSGLHFGISQSSANTVKSARFILVSNGVEQAQPLILLKQQVGCTYMGLVSALTDAATCNNMQTIDGNNFGTPIDGTTTLAAINTKFQGGAYFRLKLYSSLTIQDSTTLLQTIDNVPLIGGLPLPALAGVKMTFPTLTPQSLAALTNYTSSVGQGFQLTANSSVTVNGMHATVVGVGTSIIDDNGGSNNLQTANNQFQINLTSAPLGVTSSSYRSVYLMTPTPMYIGTKYVGCGGGSCY